MTEFVLIHGVWHGGWCWDAVGGILTERGHRVVQPTFTGLDSRRNLLTSEVGMDTFERDIVDLVQSNQLNDFVLVGHIFRGNVATVVADRMAAIRGQCRHWAD